VSKPPIIPEILQHEIAYHGFFDVHLDLLALPHGAKQHYTSVHLKIDSAAVLAQTPDGKLVLIKEYRHPTKRWLLSCPGGRLDTGESPIEAAKRELLEETGYEADEYITLGTIHPIPALTAVKVHYVLAKNAKYVAPTAHEPFELIELCLKTPAEIRLELASGNPIDGTLCTALYLLANYIPK